jgi:hypothetical protein
MMPKPINTPSKYCEICKKQVTRKNWAAHVRRKHSDQVSDLIEHQHSARQQKASKSRVKVGSMIVCELCDEWVSSTNLSRHRKRQHPESGSGPRESHVTDESQRGDQSEEGEEEDDIEGEESAEGNQLSPLSGRQINPMNPATGLKVQNNGYQGLAAENEKLKAELQQCQKDAEKWRSLYYLVDTDNASLRKRLRGNPIQWLQEDEDQETVNDGHLNRQEEHNDDSSGPGAAQKEQTPLQQDDTEDDGGGKEVDELPHAHLQISSLPLNPGQASAEVPDPITNQTSTADVEMPLDPEDSDVSMLSLRPRKLSPSPVSDSSPLSETRSTPHEPEEASKIEEVQQSPIRKIVSASPEASNKKRKWAGAASPPSRACRYCEKQGMDQVAYDEHTKTEHPIEYRPPPEGQCPVGGRLECETHGWMARISWKRHWEGRHRGEQRPEMVWFRDEHNKESYIHVGSRQRKKSKESATTATAPRQDSPTLMTDESRTDLDTDADHGEGNKESASSGPKLEDEGHITMDDSDSVGRLEGEWAFLNDENFEWRMVKREGEVQRSPFDPKLNFPFVVEKSAMWSKMREINSVTGKQCFYSPSTYPSSYQALNGEFAVAYSTLSDLYRAKKTTARGFILSIASTIPQPGSCRVLAMR